ncbi:MAG: 4-(cytidine 5'-diphospho)-2-C-methyl-D-erythritol kinase [Gemmatimonadaceae bacterium]
MHAARVVAQCKVNLFLRVLAREASGYHQLETLFCRLALGDDVTVRVGGRTRSLDVSGSMLPLDGLGPVERNLAWRAAIAFSTAAGWPSNFAIEIEKRIPVGGGLGGGSADAGAVLRTLNALAPEPLRADELIRIASTLGSDVAFLTQDTSTLALAWGRGDQFVTLPELPERRCDLVVFPFGISTPDAYRWLAEFPPPLPTSRHLHVDQLARWSTIDSLMFNDFERVIVPRYGELDRALRCLRQSSGQSPPRLALMSGSGSTVFTMVDDNTSESSSNAVGAIADKVGHGVQVIETRTSASVESVRAYD